MDAGGIQSVGGEAGAEFGHERRGSAQIGVRVAGQAESADRFDREAGPAR